MDDFGPTVRVFSIYKTWVAGLFLVVLGGLAVAAYVFKAGTTGEPKPMYLMAGIAGIVAGLGYLAFAPTAIAVHERGLVVNKVFGRRTASWSEIHRVEADAKLTQLVVRVTGTATPLLFASNHVAKDDLLALGRAVIERATLTPAAADPAFALRADRT